MKSTLSIASIRNWLLLAGVLLSVLLGYIAVHNYRSSFPVAEENLRSLALSLSETVESLVVKDPTFALLHGLKNPDAAFFAVIDANGIQVFHSNPELIGSKVEDDHLILDIRSDGFRDGRVMLGTGEEIYEFVSPLHLSGRILGVRLALHTYRADAIVRRAKIEFAVIASLLVSGWLMGVLLYRYAARAERHHRDMAEQENLAKLGTMGAVLAHEVRNPLSGIKGYAQLLEEQLTDAESRRFVKSIITESIRLEGLVNDLLAFARTEPSELAALPVGDVVDHVVRMTDSASSKVGIEINSAIDNNLIALANSDRLIQVLLNLLHNAIQAMPGGGVLSVRAWRNGTDIRVSIGDTGHGINPADLKFIFDPFFTTKARGSGLGLAISKKFIQEMNGDITVTSMPGQGSVFTVSLPAA